eukprot:366410-Chlamydomonas_euryale.AAC.11
MDQPGRSIQRGSAGTTHPQRPWKMSELCWRGALTAAKVAIWHVAVHATTTVEMGFDHSVSSRIRLLALTMVLLGCTNEYHNPHLLHSAGGG